MSVHSLSNHPENYPQGLAGIAFIGALLGKVVFEAWAAHHPHRPRIAMPVAPAAVPAPRHRLP